MKNYLIVGGSKGIGKSIVEKYATEHNVFVMSRELPTTETLNVTYIEQDATSDSIDVSALPDVLDGVVYCPGSITLKSFRSLKPEDFLEDYKVNVLGAVNILKAVERKLKQAEDGGSVVLFSTVAVAQGMPFHASIASAKAAVEGLTRSLAAEWAPSIRVNCIAPSLTNTNLASALLKTPEKVEAGNQRHPLKRIGQPEDLAAMACFLLSTEASWISGQVFAIDGGLSSLRI